MQRRGVRFAVIAALAAVAASAQAQAQTGDWGNIAVISNTLGNNAGRLCLGEGLRNTDIGCPSYAPSVTTAGHVSVTGNLSANKFIGDGSLLTGVGQSDRIVSGTTNVIATQSSSVTISTAGTQRVIIDENGSVGVGTTFPSTTLHVVSPNGLRISHPASPDGYFSDIVSPFSATYPFYIAVKNYGRPLGIKGFSGSSFASSVPFMSGYYGLGFATGANDPSSTHLRLVILSNGNVGIGTLSPTATLQVSGSFIVSTSAQTTTPSLYVETGGRVGVGTMTFGSSETMLIARNGDSFLRAHSANNSGNVGVIFSGAGHRGSIYGTAGYDIVIEPNAQFGQADIIMAPINGNTMNVGIGTTTPSATLTVSGSAIISGTVQVAGTANETCTTGKLGTIRFNPVTGAPQICVQR